MSELRFRVCVVGAGALGRRHLDGWAQVPDARVVALANVAPAQLQEAGDTYGIAGRYADFREALAREDVNVVSVCTPTRFHADVAIAALQSGRDVLCAKPIARTADEARAMLRAAEASRRTLTVGFDQRFASGLRALWEQIRAGAIGRPVFWSYRAVQEARFKLAMHERDGDGGPVLDMGVHY